MPEPFDHGRLFAALLNGSTGRRVPTSGSSPLTTAFAPVFLATVFVASITPGPSMLLALDHGVRHGPRRALATALGNVAATALQCGISLAGLGVVLARSAWFFTTLRHVGAAYLVYCGLKMILARAGEVVPSADAPRTGHRFGLFAQAFLVTLGNPKAIFFFSALFPQFIDERTLTASRASFMLTSVLAITFACMMAYATLGGRVRALLARRRARRALDAAFGLSFIGLGAGIALDRR